MLLNGSVVNKNVVWLCSRVLIKPGRELQPTLTALRKFTQPDTCRRMQQQYRRLTPKKKKRIQNGVGQCFLICEPWLAMASTLCRSLGILCTALEVCASALGLHEHRSFARNKQHLLPLTAVDWVCNGDAVFSWKQQLNFFNIIERNFESLSTLDVLQSSANFNSGTEKEITGTYCLHLQLEMFDVYLQDHETSKILIVHRYL